MGSVEAGEKKALGWAARDPSGVLSPYSYTLRFCFLFSFHKKIWFCYVEFLWFY
jgi:hypothetical protein